MDEIEIWESLLRWCFTQQNIKNDPTKWSKEDITKIERSLHRFIPLIRFYNISPTDFFYKVYCYKEILPQDLIHNLLEFHIVPNMKLKTNVAPPRKYQKFKLDSTLIESEHVSLFASWIDKKDSSYYNSKNCPYEFKLLYRSGQDGFNAESFHKNCDNKGATIWIAKVKGSTQLIGGYNPLDWSGNGNKSTTDSFLFNFTDGNDISSVKLSPINNLKCAEAIYCFNNQGPSMGSLYCKKPNNWTYYAGSTTYPNIGIPSNFTIENYEAFSIVKQ
ncbi:hypothetical protein GLOIN_2v1650304 [Rhizophagus irregularis DAOM 181602=DAOM 197198]|uniref:TLDc domain-containing protein n=3 Tax=Rhizophagus irregularis TaxID=588596 RepID=A0A015JIZ7_RHIIW|nr:hypothetical protein GLOIN_2v1650304 [Rhizophagus irregularis DAOM 181602=DAOM 197198]EXX69467.1 hypothetical protein RirG_095820 [Rhizophagus irregularis DAOM 197198w]POG67193.1 hypothetical protein GLOIN_2v1650304 [Rhizophagus irregularis DAOM 181602=DAOM 197198]|eukprot:XP_025174059.1 hypothetical protein GLOIN_2v1650304 [Rhizophagus irregularis DAOM 181602=DAOM 197198]